MGLRGDGDEGTIRERLRPVMTWKARVLAVRELEAGETVGYNATFTAMEPMRVALLPVGYADGLRRELSGSAGWVMIRGAEGADSGAGVDEPDGGGCDGDGRRGRGMRWSLGDGCTAEDHARMGGDDCV